MSQAGTEAVKQGISSKKHALEAVNEAVNEVVNDAANEVVNRVLSAISKQPGIRKPSLIAKTGKSRATVERAVATLKKLGKIEFRGAPKTGGYYSIEKA